MIVGNEYPFFVSGVVATIDYGSIDQTIIKALQEVGYSPLLTLVWEVPTNPKLTLKMFRLRLIMVRFTILN